MTRPRDASVFVEGPRPGLLGDVVGLHGRYYARHWGFPVSFECKVAEEMAAFLTRHDPARDRIVSVLEDERIRASVTLDGSDPALAKGEAHLRWFVADEQVRGQGLGKRLLREALAFAQEAGFASVYLTTFRGLDAAAALYAAAGFRVIAEAEGGTWGRRVVEQTLRMNIS